MQQLIFQEAGFINSVIDYNYKLETNTLCLDIAYGIDKNFLFGCGISIASILKCNEKSNLCFHVFTDYFGEDDYKYFDSLALLYKTRIKIYLINGERFRSLPCTSNWTYATYFRFIIADYFTNKVSKVLYLDADIICQGTIEPLIYYTFPEWIVAMVVAEGKKEWWEKRALSLGVAGIAGGYFNAGFLFINTKRWSTEQISARAIKMLSDPGIVKKIKYLDQDVLNILLTNKLIFTDVKYNTQFSLNYYLKENFENPITNDTIFIHYIGPTKPWHDWAWDYHASSAFMAAKNASPWKHSELLKPINSNQLRYSAKHMLKKHQYIKGFINYLYYFIDKIK
ncbi:lipopolysaccharide 3-alpha-galactosyltransferase [Escherichia coli]|uniref:lipopolysaccharide 3-alpha-galactosyltransferase n=1 Tax=Escherichia coli TaxID=562 RepID=UPI001F111039|nr:lipopolysaccharide 3-alpha-galactosyltransferase [Escherichia coli]UMR98313.1 lipopolysaccharide 3-alpha-galactosyltransferase [Escherichia coli]